MKNDRSRWRKPVLAGAIVLTAALGCGGGGGGDGGGRARITGNVVDAATAARASERSWLAWLGEEIVGLARRAYAAVDDTVAGIAVKVRAGSREAQGLTSDVGGFDVPDAPSGDVRIDFARGSCDASLELPDVVDGSTIDLQDLSIDCNDARPDKIVETFRGVIENKPGSPNGNLNVCAFGGGGNHIRAVRTDGADFIGTSFEDLEEGDILEATGERAGNGANSTLFASEVRVVGTSPTGNCATIATPTPESTATPGETATPETTETPAP